MDANNVGNLRAMDGRAGLGLCLVGPQMGENIGAAARIMANFGLNDLRIIAPRDGWPNQKAYAMSAGAYWPLDDAIITDDTKSAIKDATIVFATSGTPRNLDRPIMLPEQALALAKKTIEEGGKPLILFGPERSGLLDPDLALADVIITCPTDDRFPSLNLAQAVGVIAYEWARANMVAVPDGWEKEGYTPAPRASFEALFDQIVRGLDEAHFFWPAPRRESMVGVLRAGLMRAHFTLNEVNLLIGAVRHLVSGPRRRAAEPTLTTNKEVALQYFTEALDGTDGQIICVDGCGALVAGGINGKGVHYYLTIAGAVVTKADILGQ